MATASCEQYPNAQKRVVGKNFLGEWVERKAGGGRLTSSQREAMGVSAGLLTGAEPRPRMENPKPPPPPAHTGPSAFILLCFALGIPSFFFYFCLRMGPQDWKPRVLLSSRPADDLGRASSSSGGFVRNVRTQTPHQVTSAGRLPSQPAGQWASCSLSPTAAPFAINVLKQD